MNVVYFPCAYPPEMQHYARGLAEVGANVLGVGDQHPGALGPGLRKYLSDYLQVPRIMDDDDVVRRVTEWVRGRKVDRIATNWEPTVLAAARLREALDVPGMRYETALGFRDKEVMKQRLRAAGVRVPHSARCRNETEVRATAERIGFPVIVKPIQGAGSADTYRCNSEAELDEVLARTRHVPEVSCEEFVEGDEFTFDTICVDGRPVFTNVAQYLPRPLLARTEQWISPIVCTVRDMRQPGLQAGIALGHRVLSALGMHTGFTHMEWYRKENGEVVFGEIGCRPGGAHLADQMNYTCDADLFREWARATCWNSFEASTERLYNVAIVFKRALGEGTIRRIEGVAEYTKRFGRHLVWENLLPVGSHRRNWKHTLVSDGFVMVRHPDWDETLRIAFAAATDIRMYAT